MGDVNKMRVLLTLLAAAAAHAATPVAWGAGRAPSRLAMAPPTTSLNLGLRGGFIGAVRDMMSGNSDAGLDENGHYTLVLVRHGESQWNKENRFTGWVDVPLAESGMEEAHRAAKNLKEEGFTFDILYTSVLQRAIKAGLTILEDMGLLWIPIEKNWCLNERHYGALQGLNKKETVEKHGADQVNVWRRSYDVPPPPWTRTTSSMRARRPSMPTGTRARTARSPRLNASRTASPASCRGSTRYASHR